MPLSQSSVITDALICAVERAFPGILPGNAWSDDALIVNCLGRIADATKLSVTEVFTTLLNDKTAEESLRYPSIVIDPTSLTLPAEVVFPDCIKTLFIPVSKTATSVTCVCPIPLLAMSPGTLETIATAAQVPNVTVVYALPSLFEMARSALAGKQKAYSPPPASEIIEGAEVNAVPPFLDLAGFRSPDQLNALLPTTLQRRYSVVPLYLLADRYLTLAATKKPNAVQRSEIASSFRNVYDIAYVLADAGSLTGAITSNELASVDSEQVLHHLTGIGEGAADQRAAIHVDIATIRERAQENDSSIIPLLEELLAFAVKHKSSDLHITPFADTIDVECRVDDWKLAYPTPIDRRFAAPLISRIKYISGIDLQRLEIGLFGQFSIRIATGEIEIRTTVMPTIYGDSVTLRFAPKGARIKTLPELGMREHECSLIQRVVNGQSGLLLVVGPTGSGKSTTLYAVLASIDTTHYQAISAEDPVERSIRGVKQTSITENFSYDAYLATALRDDPDYINIGETRTHETAELLVRATETGHICFSTLHTAQACMAPGRMFGLGISPYSLSETLSAVIAQQLIATICPRCAYEVPPPPPSVLATAGIDPGWFGSHPTFREGRGCPHCMDRGFAGRMLLAEGYHVDSTIRGLIAAREPSRAIREAQKAQGGKTLLQQAWEFAAAGTIPLSKALAFGEGDTTTLTDSTDA